MWWYLLLRDRPRRPKPQTPREWVSAFVVAIAIIAALILIGRYA